jgi:PleD family two-component response regulator
VVTVSAGVACAAPEEMDAECLERLIRLADQRLYQAKQHRNAVVASSQAVVALVEPTLKH